MLQAINWNWWNILCRLIGLLMDKQRIDVKEKSKKILLTVMLLKLSLIFAVLIRESYKWTIRLVDNFAFK